MARLSIPGKHLSGYNGRQMLGGNEEARDYQAVRLLAKRPTLLRAFAIARIMSGLDCLDHLSELALQIRTVSMARVDEIL